MQYFANKIVQRRAFFGGALMKCENKHDAKEVNLWI